MAVVYGMFLKYVDKAPETNVQPVVLPIIVSVADTAYVEQFEVATEEPY